MRPPGALGILTAAAVCVLAMSGCGAQRGSDATALVLEREIVLPRVTGRIDHLALDAAGRRLFVAELGNGSVESLDLASGRSLGRIGGLQEPQGIGYVAAGDELAVATGGDGMLRFYRAADLRPLGAIKLGDDADNVRADAATGRLVVGVGKALALVDPARRAVVRTIALPAHPEGFQIQGSRVFVNLPDAGQVAVFDLGSGRELARWRNPAAGLNFPLALDASGGVVAVVYRLPAKLVLFDAASGKVRQQLGTCGDADDADFDGARQRLYVVCGAGAVDVFEQGQGGFARSARVPTRDGARTGLFAPKLDRLYVAARAAGGSEAAILVLRPTP